MQQALLIAAEINNGKMPPWPPGEECRPSGYLHDRSLTDAQKQTVVGPIRRHTFDTPSTLSATLTPGNPQVGALQP